jgi:hypothetical protein
MAARPRAERPRRIRVACHLSRTGLALVSGPDSVVLLDRAGKVAWRHEHSPWPRGCSGCTWFDLAGEPYAVVPDASDGCAVRRLDLESGESLAAAPPMAVPAGIHPVHQPGGWVGLSGGEGQDAAWAWWVRPADRATEGAGLRVIDAGWDDWVLSDADPSGSRVIATSHDGERLLVRSFPRGFRGRTAEEMRLVRHPPEFTALQAVRLPDNYFWDEAGLLRRGLHRRQAGRPSRAFRCHRPRWRDPSAGRPRGRLASRRTGRHLVRGYQRRIPPLPAARKLTPGKPPDRRLRSARTRRIVIYG